MREGGEKRGEILLFFTSGERQDQSWLKTKIDKVEILASISQKQNKGLYINRKIE